MGEVVSSTGFYNDRKVIRYADGTVEYPTLETIPFHQTQERIEAYRRLLSELERTGQPNPIPMHLRPQLPEPFKDRDRDHYPNEDDTENTESDTVEHYSVDPSRVRSRKHHARNKIGGGDRQELLSARPRNDRGDQQEDDSYEEGDQDGEPLTCSKSCSNLFQLFRKSDLKNRRRHDSLEGCYGHVKRPGLAEEFEMREITSSR